MRKNFAILLLFCLFICTFFVNSGVSIYANADSDSQVDSEAIDDLANDDSDEAIPLSSSSGSDFSYPITNITEHLVAEYSNYTWYKDNCYSTKDVSSAIPINMQGIRFPSSDIQQAIINTGVASSYGGCGPIAMMGILDYFARCIICNKEVDLDKDIVIVQPDSLRGLMRTINGSYINQQGIIVLVDEDIDSYLNGTLVFYYEDDIPLIE